MLTARQRFNQAIRLIAEYKKNVWVARSFHRITVHKLELKLK